MNISKKKLLDILFFIVINTTFTYIIFYFSNYFNFNSWVRITSLIIFLKMCITFLLLKRNGTNLISFSGFYLILVYLFHFGQLLISGIFNKQKFESVTNFIYILPQSGIIKTIIITIIFISFLELGLLISSKKELEKKELHIKNIKNILIQKYIGWTFLIVGLPIELRTILQKVSISLESGYLVSLEVSTPGVIGLIGNLSYVGFFILILVYSVETKKDKSIILSFLLIIMTIFSMLSGGRHYAVIILLLLFYIIDKKIMKIQFKNIVGIVLISIILLSFLNSIRDFRSIPNKEISDLIDLMFYYLKENVFISLIQEMGATIVTPYLTLEQVPRIIPFSLGKTYVLAFSTILLNISGDLIELFNSSHFVRQLQGSSLGGSVIAELYFNFSYFGVFFAYLIGLVINKVSYKIDYYINTNNLYYFSYYIPIFMYGLVWVRDAFSVLVRPIIYIGIIIYLLNNIYLKIFNKNR